MKIIIIRLFDGQGNAEGHTKLIRNSKCRLITGTPYGTGRVINLIRIPLS